MKSSQVLFSLLLVAAVAMTSCSKEDVKGCTDPDGVNYNSEAEDDDGTCKYEGKSILYFDMEDSDELIVGNITEVNYSIDGVDVGSASATQYARGIPNCGDASGVTFTKNMIQKSQTITLVMTFIDSNGDIEEVSDPEKYTITANECTPIYVAD